MRVEPLQRRVGLVEAKDGVGAGRAGAELARLGKDLRVVVGRAAVGAVLGRAEEHDAVVGRGELRVEVAHREVGPALLRRLQDAEAVRGADDGDGRGHSGGDGGLHGEREDMNG